MIEVNDRLRYTRSWTYKRCGAFIGKCIELHMYSHIHTIEDDVRRMHITFRMFACLALCVMSVYVIYLYVYIYI